MEHFQVQTKKKKIVGTHSLKKKKELVGTYIYNIGFKKTVQFLNQFQLSLSVITGKFYAEYEENKFWV